MKNKKQIAVAVLVVLAFVARILQFFLTTEFKTGFFKPNFTVLGAALTGLAVALSAAAAIVGRKAFRLVKNETTNLFTAISSGLMAASIGYELVSEKITVSANAWQDVAMKGLGILAVVYFGALLVKGFVDFALPDVLHTIPALYLIVRIICSFINISSLTLITENVFLIASYCCLLLFFVDYSSFYCLDDTNIGKLNLKCVLAFTVCVITSITNIVANFVIKGYSHTPLYSQIVLFAFAIFVLSFVVQNRFKALDE